MSPNAMPEVPKAVSQVTPKLDPKLDSSLNWRLSNAPKLSAEEALHLLRPDTYSAEEKQRYAGKWFWQDVVMGMDPEFFIATKEGVPLPAFKVLASKQDNPYLFWDGFQAECTVYPRRCHQELAQNLAAALSRVQYKILPSPIWRVPKELLLTAEHEHVRLGCDPSHNAYGMHGKPVEDGRQLGWRFAGGHVHFELPDSFKIPPRIRSIVRSLDAILAVACVCFAQGVDQQIRRKYYGLPGEFRLPAHGIEYRTLSNFWMYHPQAYHLVFDLARFAFNVGKAGLRCFLGDADLIVNIVQFGDVRAARDLVKLNSALYDGFLRMYYPPAAQAAFWRSIEQGFLKTVPDYGKDVNAAWRMVYSEYNQPMWEGMR